MADRCFSTLSCAKADHDLFEEMGYKADELQALTVDGDEIPDVQVMVDEEAAGGNYSELTALRGVPFLVSNTGCRGAFGDHLLVSDGDNWSYAESLHESNYPAVRVNRYEGVSEEGRENARKYGTSAPARWRRLSGVPHRPEGNHEERARAFRNLGIHDADERHHDTHPVSTGSVHW